jgi:hypothetical protein
MFLGAVVIPTLPPDFCSLQLVLTCLDLGGQICPTRTWRNRPRRPASDACTTPEGLLLGLAVQLSDGQVLTQPLDEQRTG